MEAHFSSLMNIVYVKWEQEALFKNSLWQRNHREPGTYINNNYINVV